MVATLNLNGVEQKVHVLTPTNNSELAVVHLSVLKRLAELLPKASIETIKWRVAESIAGCKTLEELVSLLRDELAFQESVNLIQSIDAEQINAKKETLPW